jgi:hypothetical protein
MKRAEYLRRRIGRLVELYVSMSLRGGNDPTLNDRLATARINLHEALDELTELAK